MDSPRPSHARRARDWAVDSALFLCAAAYGVLVSAFAVQDPSVTPGTLLFTLDQLVGVAACASLWWRRRWPMQIGLALALVSAFSETSSGAMVVGLFTVASSLGLRAGAAVFAVSLAAAVASVSWRFDAAAEARVILAIGIVVHAAAVGWGVALHQRRALVDALRERAERAETEAEVRAERARRENRDEIAREIHDALGHRLSLLSVHAGALEHRTDPAPEEVRAAVGIIRQSAHDALQDLRTVVGVLRAPTLDVPQPTLRDLDDLLEDSRAAGTEVTLRREVSGEPPDAQQRAVYRTVQEGLTNAHKHAPGASVEVHLRGRPGSGIAVTVVDSGAPVASRRTSPPRDAHGLLGLGERVRHLGGDVTHGPSADHRGWELRVWLPWTP